MYLLLLRSRCGRGHSCECWLLVVAGVVRAELLVPAAARSGVLPLPPSDPSWPQAPESARRRTRKHQARWLRTCQGIWHPKSHSDTRGPSLTTVFTHYRCHSLTLSVSLCFLLYCFNNNNNNNNLGIIIYFLRRKYPCLIVSSTEDCDDITNDVAVYLDVTFLHCLQPDRG